MKMKMIMTTTNKVFTFFFKNDIANDPTNIDEVINRELNIEGYEPISISNTFVKYWKGSNWDEDGEICVMVVGKQIKKDEKPKIIKEEL